MVENQHEKIIGEAQAGAAYRDGIRLVARLPLGMTNPANCGTDWLAASPINGMQQAPVKQVREKWMPLSADRPSTLS